MTSAPFAPSGSGDDGVSDEQVVVTGAVLFSGLAGLLFEVAMRTGWHPKAIESHLYRFGEYVPYRRMQPWGRARILVLAAGCAFVAWRSAHRTVNQ